jgi:hypothetical protein
VDNVAIVSYPDDELSVFSTISSREIVYIIDSKYRIAEEESELQLVSDLIFNADLFIEPHISEEIYRFNA